MRSGELEMLIVLAMLVLVLGLGVHVRGAGAEDTAPSALDLVRSSVARAHGVGRSVGSRDPESERIEMRRTATPLFDVEAMSRRMLAQHWNDGSAAQQAEFIRLLTDLLEQAFSNVIVIEAGGSTIFDGESIDGAYAQVRFRIATDRGPDIAIEYRLSKSGERWLVYDVLHEGASLVLDCRGQFVSILRTSSFAQLLERMRGNEAQARVAAEDSTERFTADAVSCRRRTKRPAMTLAATTGDPNENEYGRRGRPAPG